MGKGTSARSVLKRLLSMPGRRAYRGTVQEDIWPGASLELADKHLYEAIYTIRKVIGRELVTTTGAIYELADQAHIWVDMDRCTLLLKQAENLGHTSLEAVPLLKEALSYCERGEYLEGEEGIWCYAARHHAEDTFRQCRLWLAEAYKTQGKLYQAEEQYRALCQTLVPDEEALQSWIMMLSQHGKGQEALKRYHDTKQLWEMQGFMLSSTLEEQATGIQKQVHRPHTPTPASPGGKISLELPPWQKIDGFSPLRALPNTSFEQLWDLEKPLSINEETLQLFATMTENCRHLSEGNELRIAEHILWTYLPKLEFVARLSSEHQGGAAHIVSQGYLLAASLVGHRNNLLDRLHYSEQALRYGELAGDLNLQTVALRQIAISFDCINRPDKVIEISQRTFAHLKGVSPLLQACIYAGVSGAYAELGQRQDALRFIGLAYEHFPEHPENEPGYLHTICRYSTLLFFDGLNSLGFGQPREAEKTLARIDGLQPNVPLPERVRIELLNYQVTVFIALNAMEQACTYLEAATEAARSVGSERHFRDAFSLFHQMQKKWRRESQVQNLADLFVQ